MSGSRMSFNVWIKVKHLFTNPYNENLNKRIGVLIYALSWWKDYLFWKDSFSYIIRIWCLIVGHKYYHARYDKYNGYYPMFCQRCSKTHKHVRTICKIKRKRKLRLRKIV